MLIPPRITTVIVTATVLAGLTFASAGADAAQPDRSADFMAKVSGHRHAAKAHRVSRRAVATGPVLAGPRSPYVDDGSRYDTEYDGVAIGREGDLVPRDGSGPRFARSGASFEIEGPPISPSLPVIPELVDPSLY